MVLESLINPFKAEKKPWEVFFIGALYTSLAIFLSLWIFEKYASLVMVFLTTIACVPLFHSTMKYEEEKDVEMDVGEIGLLKEHSKALKFFVYAFLGMAAAFAFWYIVLPQNMTAGLFSVQTETITRINSRITGSAAQLNLLKGIFLNNIKVLVFCILFSFLYGSGVIFILVWNASVISVAVGNFIRNNLGFYAGQLGLGKGAAYFYTTSMSFVRYFTHGIPEILAYFVAGLAGGIISVAMIKHNVGTKRFGKVLTDVLDLLLISVVILLVAALMEVYFTPLFF